MPELKKREGTENTQTVTFHCSSALKDRVDAFATRTGYTKGSIFSVALEQFLDREEAKQ